MTLIVILFFCVSLPGYTWQPGLNYTNIKLQKLQDKNLIHYQRII